MTKAGNKIFEEAVLKAMEEVGIPISISFMEQKFDMKYPTASRVLTVMAESGKIKMLKTTAQSFYILLDWKP